MKIIKQESKYSEENSGAGMSPATAGRTAVRFILPAQGCLPRLRDGRLSGLFCWCRAVQNVQMWCPKCLTVVLNDTPTCRSRAREKSGAIGSQNGNRKVRIQLQRSDILIAGVGCPEWRVVLRHNRDRETVTTEGNPPRLMSRMRLLAVQNVQNGKVRMKAGKSEYSSKGATY